MHYLLQNSVNCSVLVIFSDDFTFFQNWSCNFYIFACLTLPQSPLKVRHCKQMMMLSRYYGNSQDSINELSAVYSEETHFLPEQVIYVFRLADYSLMYLFKLFFLQIICPQSQYFHLLVYWWRSVINLSSIKGPSRVTIFFKTVSTITLFSWITFFQI